MSHEIDAKQEFCKSLSEPRHMARKCVTGSLEGWIESPSDITDKIIGYDTKNSAQMLESERPIILNSSLGLEDFS